MLVPIPGTLKVCNHNQYSLQIVFLGDHKDYNNEHAYNTQNIIISAELYRIILNNYWKCNHILYF